MGTAGVLFPTRSSSCGNEQLMLPRAVSPAKQNVSPLAMCRDCKAADPPDMPAPSG